MKAKGVGNKPAPYLLVFTLFLGAVYLSAIFRTGYFCRQEGSEFMAKSKGGVTVSKVCFLIMMLQKERSVHY